MLYCNWANRKLETMKIRKRMNLLAIRINGIKNFTEEVEIRFHKWKSLDDFEPTNDRVRAIYGPNGSGKTAIITAVWLATNIIRSNDFLAYLGPSYFLNQLNKTSHVFSFEVDFCEQIEDIANHSMSIGKSYRYSISIDATDPTYIHISHEAFWRFNGQYGKSKLIPIFETKEGKIELSAEFETDIVEQANNIVLKNSFAPFLLGYTKRKANSRIPKDDLENFFRFFFSIGIFLNNEDTHITYFDSYQNMQNLKLEEFPTTKEPDSKFKGVNFYQVRKEGIDRFDQFLKRKTNFIRLFKPNLKTITFEKKEEKDFYICYEILDYGSYTVDVDFESAGIQKLMLLYENLYFAANGGTVFIDEFDQSISGPYLRKLIQFINNYGSGQLCFTAHSLEAMKALSDESGSVYFIGENNEITEWRKNAHYKPYILYPEGMIRGINFDVDVFDFIKAFSGK